MEKIVSFNNKYINTQCVYMHTHIPMYIYICIYIYIKLLTLCFNNDGDGEEENNSIFKIYSVVSPSKNTHSQG